MTHIWQGLRSGHWLTAGRIRGYSLLLLGIAAIAVAGWIALSDGLVDRNGKAIGTDFASVYAAGTLTWQGRPGDSYVPARQYAAEKAVFDGRDVGYCGWHYPPLYFAICFAVAAFPYAWGLVLWLAASFAAYLAAIRAILPRVETLLVASAFPAVFDTIGHGQNSFLTTALLGGALHWLDRRPWLAGILIGCLAYKPQFGLLIPLVLVVSGRWRTIGAAAATVATLVALSFAAFGSETWHAFVNSVDFTQTVVLEQGDTGWHKIQSAFSAVRMWGGGTETAYQVQTAVALMVAGSLAWLWHSDAAFELKGAALATGSLLATPYVIEYDLTLLAIAVAFLVRYGLARGFRNFEISMLAAVWAVPLLARSVAQATGIPLGLLVLSTLYIFIMRRALWDRQRSTFGAAGIAQA
jgi:hypothetical protein